MSMKSSHFDCLFGTIDKAGPSVRIQIQSTSCRQTIMQCVTGHMQGSEGNGSDLIGTISHMPRPQLVAM
jgi:hypothetical protein